jgi:hypothetical protein
MEKRPRKPIYPAIAGMAVWPGQLMRRILGNKINPAQAKFHVAVRHFIMRKSRDKKQRTKMRAVSAT